MNDLAQAAVEYLTAGLHVLALTQKRPNARVHGEHWSYDDSFHGIPSCIEEANAIKEAFSPERGTTGIAICIPPGMLVADVDTDRAAQLLTDLGFHGSDDTVMAQTKNGLHIWFVWPGGDRNWWAGDGQVPDPGRTLLFKGLGGYVVAPPSLHYDERGNIDGNYRWLYPLVVNGMIQMPDILPAEAAARMRRAELWAGDREAGKEQVSSFTLTPVPGLKWWQWPRVATYVTEGLEHSIETAADGNQNNVIHWAACVCRDEGVPFEVAMERLMAAAERGNHPKSRARDTIRSAYKRSPRG